MPEPESPSEIAAEIARLELRQSWHRLFACELVEAARWRAERRTASYDEPALSLSDIDDILVQARGRIGCRIAELRARLDASTDDPQ